MVDSQVQQSMKEIVEVRTCAVPVPQIMEELVQMINAFSWGFLGCYTQVQGHCL